MKITIIKDIKLAISPRETKYFVKGEKYEYPNIPKLACERLIELNCAELNENKRQANKTKKPISKVKKQSKK